MRPRFFNKRCCLFRYVFVEFARRKSTLCSCLVSFLLGKSDTCILTLGGYYSSLISIFSSSVRVRDSGSRVHVVVRTTERGKNLEAKKRYGASSTLVHDPNVLADNTTRMCPSPLLSLLRRPRHGFLFHFCSRHLAPFAPFVPRLTAAARVCP